MKKVIAVILAAIMAIAICACGTQPQETTAAAPETTVAVPETTTEPAKELYTGEEFGASLGDKTLKSGETWHVDDSCVVDKLEIEDGVKVDADFPVIVFFKESKTVENGAIMGNVQFVSDYDEVVAIVHTNDTHGYLQTEPYVKGLKTQLADSGKYSLVLAVNAGDVYAGGYAAAHIYNGEYIPYIMTKTYDYMTWGNNDAGMPGGGIVTYMLAILGNAEGLTTLLANQDAAVDIDIASFMATYEPYIGKEEFVDLYSDILSLNADGTINYDKLNLAEYNLQTGANALQDTAIVETSKGSKISLIGESIQGGSLTDQYFAGGQSTVDVAQAMTNKLLEEGATSTVLICHTGWFDPPSTEGSSNDTNTNVVAQSVTGLDAIIDGHTHSVINEGEGWLFAECGNAPLVNQAFCKENGIGVMYLYLKDGKVIAKDGELLQQDDTGAYEGIEADADVQKAVDRCYKRLEDDGYTEVVATSQYFLNGERISAGDIGGGVRANETNLGDLCADGILWTAQQKFKDYETKVAFYPGTWVRSSLEAGDITLINALSVFANPLKIYCVEYTAQGLVEKMTKVCSVIGQEKMDFMQTAGIKCTYNPQTLEVVSLKVGDELIYENGQYLVDSSWKVGVAATAMPNDNFAMPDGATVVVDSNTDMAKEWCTFLKEGKYTIFPNEVAPDGRLVPAE